MKTFHANFTVISKYRNISEFTEYPSGRARCNNEERYRTKKTPSRANDVDAAWQNWATPAWQLVTSYSLL